MSISANLDRIRNEIADACTRAHRDPATVALMAVSKMHPAEALLEALAGGQYLFGENRVQEWQSKTVAIAATGLEMHLIGPLQNNKTNKAAELFHAVDTIDSFKTAEIEPGASPSFIQWYPRRDIVRDLLVKMEAQFLVELFF